jgi:hypothetical protein
LLRNGGFLGGEDNEILVVFIAIGLKLVVFAFIVPIVIGSRSGRLAIPGDGHRLNPSLALLFEIGTLLSGRIPIIRGGRLWRHETNRCCTAGMTADRMLQRTALARRSYAIRMNSAKQLDRLNSNS